MLNGTVQIVPDGGALVFGFPTPGAIAVIEEQDEWTFFGRAGRAITLLVNPGVGNPPDPLTPPLGLAQVDVLDDLGNVIDSANNFTTGSGTPVLKIGTILPADETYRMRLHAPAPNIGNYLLTVWDGTIDVAALPLNQPLAGSIEAPFSIDRWVFVSGANQQVTFDLLGASSSNLQFTLTGPNGFVGFNDISSDSPLVSLPIAGEYTLDARTVGQATGSYAFKLVSTTITDLSPGVAHEGALVGSTHAQLFRVNVAAAQPLVVEFGHHSSDTRSELRAIAP